MDVCPAVWQAEDHGVLVEEAKAAGWHDNSSSTEPASFSYMTFS